MHAKLDVARITAAVFLCFAVQAAAAAFTEPGVEDPVSGTWGSDGLPYLELKYDGEGVVSGTAIWRHGTDEEHRTPISRGSFDPKTGALRLEGEGRTPEGVVATFLIEGKIEGDVVSGTYRFGSASGEFAFKRQ